MPSRARIALLLAVSVVRVESWTCTFVYGEALYPFGTGANASVAVSTMAECATQCETWDSQYGCEYDPGGGWCHNANGPITGQAPLAEWDQ